MNDEGVENEQARDRFDSQDAMAATPGHHRVLFENERVRVLESWSSPGDSTPTHTHCWPSVLYILGVSHFVRYDAEGRPIFDSRSLESGPEPGTVQWSPPLQPHSVKNVGSAELRVISIELKDG